MQVIGALSSPAFKAMLREPLAALDRLGTVQSQAIKHS